MEFKRLSESEGSLFEKAMELYQISFPAHEQRERASQTRIMTQAAYHFDLIYEGDIWVGMILWWEAEAFRYVEHFCMWPSMRGKGYGQKALALLNAPGKTVILEIDPPADAVSVHRKRFYERAGYEANPFLHVHPPYHKENGGHRLVVMSYPARLSEMQYRAFDAYLKQTVMA